VRERREIRSRNDRRGARAAGQLAKPYLHTVIQVTFVVTTGDPMSAWCNVMITFSGQPGIASFTKETQAYRHPYHTRPTVT